MTAPGATTSVASPARHRARRGARWANPTRLMVGLRRHWLVVVLVALAAVIRVLVMMAYPPAFWFAGDSGVYIDLSEHLYPHRDRALGYPVLLAVLRVTGTLAAVTAVQHLAGLALGIGIYALLRRRGLGPGVASLASTPILFDALQIDLEHYILTETLFTALLLLSIGVLLWWRTPGVVACATAGVLMAGAWLTRPVALGVAVLLAGYLALRRVGWRRFVAFGAAFAVPWAAVLLWIDGRPTIYGSGSTGMYLYGPTAVIADCDRLLLPAEQRWLCPPHPRHARPDWYVWAYLAPEYRNDPANDAALRDFALNVIAEQPDDYLGLVAIQTAPFFSPWPGLDPEFSGLSDQWVLPAWTPGTVAPALAGPGYQRDPAQLSGPPQVTGLTEFLHWYGRHIRTPAPLTLAVVIMAGVAVVLRRRSSAWPDARDAGLLVVVTVAFLVAQVATSMYDPRYGLPALGLVAVAGALCWQALRGLAGPGDLVEQRDEVVAVPALRQRLAEPAELIIVDEARPPGGLLR